MHLSTHFHDFSQKCTIFSHNRLTNSDTNFNTVQCTKPSLIILKDQVYLTCVLCKLTSIRYHVFIHFYRTVCSSFPFMSDICLIYEYLRNKSSYFNSREENQERVNQVSDILLVDCSLRIAKLYVYKILSLIKLDPFKTQVSNIYN